MSKTNFNELIQSSTPVIVDFHATWCGPCKAFAPILQQFKDEMGDKIKIIKIDIDKNESFAGQLGIRSVPTIHIYHEGELKWSASGLQPITELRNQVQRIVQV